MAVKMAGIPLYVPFTLTERGLVGGVSGEKCKVVRDKFIVVPEHWA
jgi:hypothetical protein